MLSPLRDDVQRFDLQLIEKSISFSFTSVTQGPLCSLQETPSSSSAITTEMTDLRRQYELSRLSGVY